MMLKYVCLLAAVASCSADLRMASQPKKGWTTQQRNNNVQFKTKFNLYMEPSAFNYQGLENQRDGGGYDNFLRSNIDNEQDRRNFDTEDGKDHLPFRSYETSGTDASTTVKLKMTKATAAATGVTEAGDYMKVKAGEPNTMAMRWNNPHAAELEVNIWLMNKAGGPYVVPVKKPTCSGEGYQDKAFSFTVPADFYADFCVEVGDCVLQVYAHSVESRMYSSGTPLIVAGGTGVWSGKNILPAEKDVAFGLKQLRALCLPQNSDDSAHKTTKVHKARLSSDVYNHAYQNSDFSPYAGQQPGWISQNLQASCILKMTVGNFGELGKEYMKKTANEARDYAGKLDKKARNLIRIYETTTNSIIYAIQEKVKNRDTLPSAFAAPAGAVDCVEWRDQYDRSPEGRLRGRDRHGGWCPKDTVCLCHSDCVRGYGKNDASGPDAYCGVLEPNGKTVDKKDAAGVVVKDAAGEAVKVPLRKVKADSSVARIGESAQRTEICFRCAETGSIKVKRQNTNTYIPSFEIDDPEATSQALDYVAPMHLKSGFLTTDGKITTNADKKATLQIYMAVLTEMWAEFKSVSDGTYIKDKYPKTYAKLEKAGGLPGSLEKYKFTYRGPVIKTGTATLDDATAFKKVNAEGTKDKGYYASKMAWPLQARETGSSEKVPDTDTIDAGLYNFPPKALVAGNCGFTEAGATGSDAITALGKDMDGLNYDADCDKDDFVEKANLAHDAACILAEEKYEELGPDYTEEPPVCAEYPDVVCKIKGQNGRKPGQMFTNDEEGGGGVSAASAMVPSTFVVALLVSLWGLF